MIETDKNSMTFNKFVQELQEIIFTSVYAFNKKHYFFDNSHYPDIEAILMLPKFQKSANAELLLKKIHDQLVLESIEEYTKAISKYQLEKTEGNYKKIGELIVPIAESYLNRIQEREALQKSEWITEFEKEFQLLFFGKTNEEKNIVYFENMKQSEYYVKIDQTRRVIHIKKFSPENTSESVEKTENILNCLLDNTDKWHELGLITVSEDSVYVIKKVIEKDFHYEVFYGEKETLNAFGNYDWSEF